MHTPSAGLVNVPADDLRAFAARLADESERWAHLLDGAGGDGDARVYELIWDDDEVNAWVIRWSEDADTGFHDHDESAAAITVIAGRVREDRLALGPQTRSREFGPGETFTVEPTAIHRVLHAGSGPALTIHAYSPPLRRTGAYRIGPDGELQRESQPFEVELRAEPALA
jgi:mannose-6-phosphate isomerase-like protein (cupin superfamily)